MLLLDGSWIQSTGMMRDVTSGAMSSPYSPRYTLPASTTNSQVHSPCAVRTTGRRPRSTRKTAEFSKMRTPAASAACSSPRQYFSGCRWPEAASNTAEWKRGLSTHLRRSPLAIHCSG